MKEEKIPSQKHKRDGAPRFAASNQSDWNLRRETVSHQLHSRTFTDRIRPTMRGFVGIVTGICALYLTVGAVDAPCNDHSRGGISGSGVAAMPHHDGSSNELPAQQSEQPKPCKSAAIPCCVAMTSCGTTIALGASVSSTVFPIAVQIVPSFHLAHPLGRIAAPEPPPPKA